MLKKIIKVINIYLRKLKQFNLNKLLFFQILTS